MNSQHTYPLFLPSFVAEHQDLFLFKAFHHLQACLLYPPFCACVPPCVCEHKREKISLSLNTALYNRMEAEGTDEDRLRMVRFLLNIPEDIFFRKHQAEAYPLWLVREEFQKREAEGSFQIVSRLVWVLLTLAKDSQGRASLREATQRILGKSPLKTKQRHKSDYLGGEKAYGKQFNLYKSVCHLIAAAVSLKEAQGGVCFFSVETPLPSHITRFLNLSEAIRMQLLTLQTPNVKKKSLFSETGLVSLPAWIKPEEEESCPTNRCKNIASV